MKKENLKKTFLIIFFASFLFLIFSNYILAAELELKYPQVAGAEVPNTTKTTLPNYVKYLFNFSIIIAALIAFASFVFGGFRYISSAGSPNALKDAKDQISAGILGLIIILASWLLLTTINPQLIFLTVLPKQFAKGVILYAGDEAACRRFLDAPEKSGEEGKDFLRVRRSLDTLEGFNGKAQSIYFYDSSDELEVFIFPETNYKGTSVQSYRTQDAGNCAPVSGGSSIELYWKIPGVYLFAEKDYAVTTENKEPKLFIADTAEFVDWHDKALSLKILPFTQPDCRIGLEYAGACKYCPDCESIHEGYHCSGCLNPVPTTIAKYGAIVHEQTNFEGDCEVFFQDDPDFMAQEGRACPNSWPGPYCVEGVADRASAIHIFKQSLSASDISGEGVTLYADYDWNQEGGGKQKDDCAGGDCKCGPITGKNNRPTIISPLGFTDGASEPAGSDCTYVLGHTNGSSIKVDGNYIAVLFRLDGRCEVFKPSGDYRLDGNHIGNDKAWALMVIPVSRDN